jgi:hypothetical protein
MDERLKQILNDALDQSLRDYVHNLFTVMMRDPTDQPERAATGARKAITAWRKAVNAIEEMGTEV